MTDGATLNGRALAQTAVTLIANTITVPGGPVAPPAPTPKHDRKGTFIGVLQSIAADKIVVEGKTFKVTSSTTLEQGLATGMTVRVKFTTQADGSTLATDVKSKHPDQGVRAGQQKDGEGEDQGGGNHQAHCGNHQAH